MLYLLLISLLGTALAIKWQSIMDYLAYSRQWARVLDSADPWDAEKTNAYGPLHNLFAWPYALHSHLPKVLFVWFWLAATCLVARAAWLRRGPAAAWAVAIFLTVTPFFWGGAIHFGFNDVPAAVLIFAAVALRQRGHLWLAGAMLGLATLLKIYPLLMLPFLALDGRKFDLRPIVSCVVVTAIGVGLSFLAWGDGTLHPIQFASERPEAKWLSPVAFLDGRYSPLRLMPVDTGSMPQYSKLAMLAMIGLVWIACWRFRVSTLTACLAGMMGVLLSYHVGHVQFWMFLPLLAAWGWANREAVFDRPGLRWPMVVMLVWLNAFLAWYWFGALWTQGDSLARNLVGLPHTVLALWLIVALIAQGRNAGQPKPASRSAPTPAVRDERQPQVAGLGLVQ